MSKDEFQEFLDNKPHHMMPQRTCGMAELLDFLMNNQVPPMKDYKYIELDPNMFRWEVLI